MSLLMQSTEIRFWNWLIPIAPTHRQKKTNQITKSTKTIKILKSDISVEANLQERIAVIASIPVHGGYGTANQSTVFKPTIAPLIPNPINLERTMPEVIAEPSAIASSAKLVINPQLFMILSSSSLGFLIGLMISIFM